MSSSVATYGSCDVEGAPPRAPRNDWLLGHPREIARVIEDGAMRNPRTPGVETCLSFCPGLKGAWSGFTTSLKCGWKSFKWACGFTGWGMTKCAWELVKGLWERLTNNLKSIPADIGKELDFVHQLIDQTPIFWWVRVICNMAWSVTLWPILKTLLCLAGYVVTPLVVGGLLVVGVVGRCVLGLIGTVVCGISSLVPLIGGSTISLLCGVGAATSRFPRETDIGRFGVYSRPCPVEDPNVHRY